MNIFIEKITSSDSIATVDFFTKYGRATAQWEGDKPTTNSDYHVEIDFNDTLTWDKDIQRDETGEFSIKMHNNEIVFCGILDSYDDDGYAVLRIGEDIIPFVSKGVPFQLGAGIKLKLSSVTLTQIDYF